jgi:hypothetical protein
MDSFNISIDSSELSIVAKAKFQSLSYHRNGDSSICSLSKSSFKSLVEFLPAVVVLCNSSAAHQSLSVEIK